MGLTDGTRGLTITASLAVIAAFVCHAIAFATSNWLVSDGKSPFVKIGFHEACFNKCRIPYCPGNDFNLIFDGCAWVNAFYFDPIHYWIMADFFLICFYMAVANVILIFFLLIVMLVCWWQAFEDSYKIKEHTVKRNRKREAWIVGMLFAASILSLITTVIAVAVLALFYSYAFKFDYWMPLPEKNHLGFSYWCEVAAAGLLAGAFVCTLSAAMTKLLRAVTDKNPEFSEDMLMSDMNSSRRT